MRRHPGGPSRRTLIAILAVVVAVPVGALAAGVVAFTVHGRGEPAATARSVGADAAWLGHAWVDGRRSRDDVAAFARRISGTGIRDVFVHAGPLDADGTLPATRRPAARSFVTAMHELAPGVRVQAWLGTVVGSGRFDLADPASRARVVEGARAVLDDGFDGVHYDLEPIPDADPGFVALLRDTRQVTRARGAVLSVAVPAVEPLPGTRRPVRALLLGHPKWWSEGYLARVARDVDQVAVMSYDSGQPFAGAYTGFMRRQTAMALRAVPAGVGLLMGVPAYHDIQPTHYPWAETTRAAVRGVRLGLGGRPPRPGLGLALYVDFTATEQDWVDLRNGWGPAG